MNYLNPIALCGFLLFTLSAMHSSNENLNYKLEEFQESEYKTTHQHLDSMVRYYSMVNLDSADRYGQLYIKNAMMSQNDHFIFDAYYVNSYVQFMRSNHKMALEYAHFSRRKAEKMKNPVLLSKSYNILASAEHSAYNYTNALKYHLKSLEIAKMINDSRLLSAYLHNTAIFYKDIGDYGKAREYLEKSIHIAQVNNYAELFHMAQNNLGDCLIKLNENKKGHTFLEDSYDYFEENQNFQGMSEITIIYAEEYNKRGEFAESNQMLQKAVQLSKKMSNDILLAQSYLRLAENFDLLDMQDSLFFYLSLSCDLNLKLNRIKDLQLCNQLLYKYYCKKGMYGEAIKYNDLYIQYNDSLSSLQNQANLSKIKFEFESAQQRFRDSLLLVQVSENFQRNEIAKRNEMQLYFSLALFTLVIASLLILIYLRRSKKKILREREILLDKIELLKWKTNRNNEIPCFNQAKISERLAFNLNKTDWSILEELYKNPSITNNELTERVFVSYEGVRSSLKKMYCNFEIDPKTKNKKVSLVMTVIKLSSNI